MLCFLRRSAHPVLHVERMHLQRGGVDKKARADEFVEFPMLAQHVADVLAQKTLDALAELLHAIDVRLLHAPGAVGRVGLARPELLDGLLDSEIPGNVGHQIANGGKVVHRLHGHRHVQRSEC